MSLHIPEGRMLTVLARLNAGCRLQWGVQGFRLHGPKAALPAGAQRDIPKKLADEMIELGYIGRQDQRAIYHITERGKLALADALSHQE